MQNQPNTNEKTAQQQTMEPVKAGDKNYGKPDQGGTTQPGQKDQYGQKDKDQYGQKDQAGQKDPSKTGNTQNPSTSGKDDEDMQGDSKQKQAGQSQYSSKQNNA